MTRKTAIVTGASRGIGKTLAVRLAQLGYDLILTARGEQDLEQTALACRAAGANATVHPADITSEMEVRELFATVTEEFSRIDLLVNNAGMGIFKPLCDTALADWQQVINTNLNGTFLCSREAFKIMQQQQEGTIINIASVVGLKGYPNQGAYSASKHGIVGLSKVLAEEGRPHNIRVHVLCPGGVATEMVKQSRPDLNPDEIIQPEDIADLMEYLLKLPPRVTVDLVHLRRFNSPSF